MNNYLRLLRVKHYLKNGLVFLPLFFSGNLLNDNKLFVNFLGFLNFCIAASIIYIFNDIRDVEKDRRHPTKCKRPIASGQISIKKAYSILICLFVLFLVIGIIINKHNIFSWLIILIYIIINLMYSYGLKNVVLLDVFILVLGYVLRLYYGASIIDVKVSPWLYLTVMSFAFYLGLGKRRNELALSQNETRSVLKKYNKDFLDKNMYMCLSLTIVFYSLWAENMATYFSNTFLLLSVPIVIIICMRYSLLIEQGPEGDPVEVIFSDKLIIFLVLFFIIYIFLVLYVNFLCNFAN